MTPPATLRRVQWHYERLQAAQPDLPHREMWRQAEQAAAFSDDPSDEELWQYTRQTGSRPIVRSDNAVRRINTLATVGFVLVCLATMAATVSLVLFFTATQINTGPWPRWWIASFLLGPLALTLLLIAKAMISRSVGLEPARRLVKVGLRVAVVGTVEVALPVLLIVGAVSEGL